MYLPGSVFERSIRARVCAAQSSGCSAGSGALAGFSEAGQRSDNRVLNGDHKRLNEVASFATKACHNGSRLFKKSHRLSELYTFSGSVFFWHDLFSRQRLGTSSKRLISKQKFIDSLHRLKFELAAELTSLHPSSGSENTLSRCLRNRQQFIAVQTL